jgi:DhnA family fructose-bisphosphate aldolase class Ia
MGFRKARMNRLFAKTGKCFDVAVDHGFFNEGRVPRRDRGPRTRP